MIEERLRLPMYLLLAGRNDEGWEELNRLNARYIDQFSQPVIANQMRVFRSKEGKNRPAAPGEIDISRENATTLAHTAAMTAGNQAAMATLRTNADLIAKVKWSATLDLSTCIACGARDGKTWTNDENNDPIDHSIPFSMPPLHLNCRCALTWVLKSFKELGIDAPEVVMRNGMRASMDGMVPKEVSYPEWLQKQHWGRQDQVLGSERAQLWRDKKFTFEQMLDIHGQELPLAELKTKYGC